MAIQIAARPPRFVLAIDVSFRYVGVREVAHTINNNLAAQWNEESEVTENW